MHSLDPKYLANLDWKESGPTSGPEKGCIGGPIWFGEEAVTESFASDPVFGINFRRTHFTWISSQPNQHLVVAYWASYCNHTDDCEGPVIGVWDADTGKPVENVQSPPAGFCDIYAHFADLIAEDHHPHLDNY